MPSNLSKYGLSCIMLMLAVGGVCAQPAAPLAAAQPASVPRGFAPTLRQIFDAAWLRQPEAQSLAARREAAMARRQAADSWTSEPVAMDLAAKGDRLNKNEGNREFAAGLVIPLWLPGEKARSGALADAETRAGESRVLAAQLRIAAGVRLSYWQWQAARIEHALARERQASARQLAADVARRVQAGFLARADQHQADGAAAGADAAVAEAASALASALQQLRALFGGSAVDIGALSDDVALLAEAVPALPADFAALDATHPAVVALLDRAEVARRATELARAQSRANPELLVATTRDRGFSSEPYRQTMTLGIRLPFGSDSRNRARVAAALAESLEAEGQLGLERDRLTAELDAARVRLESARAQLAAADERARLARESRGFFDKSFRLGESDLPTRLRIELEAAEAGRQAVRARINLASTVSALRQALGLLPE